MAKKILKKSLAAVICAFCMITGILSCTAASQSYKIDALAEMSITLPDDMLGITRESTAEDKYFSLFGLDYTDTMENFKNNDIYFQGMDTDSEITVTVTMTKTDDSEGIRNYSLLDEEELGKVVSNFIEQNEYNSCTPDDAGKTTWLYFETQVNANGGKIKAYQANTVYDGTGVNITLQRNEGNVEASDYEVLQSITSQAEFGDAGLSDTVKLIIFIGSGVAAVVLVVILILIIRKVRRKSSQRKNNKILGELADKYNLSDDGKSGTCEDDESDFVDISPDSGQQDKVFYEYENATRQTDENEHADISSGRADKVISDEEIDEILSSAHTAESFGESLANKAYDEQSNTVKAESAEETADNENFGEIGEQNAEYGEEPNDEERDLTEDGLTEDEEVSNDEVLVREEAKRNKFSDSDDFFDEAPKKARGIISTKELDDAEDFDVITEIEQQVTEVESEVDFSDEKENAEKTSVADVLVKAGGGLSKFGKGVKLFFVHCGYFCTNVHRMIKRKRAAAKRRKAEEERRERARRREEQRRQQRRAEMEGTLVRVRSRGERRQPNRSSSSRGPSRQGRKSSRNQRSGGGR